MREYRMRKILLVLTVFLVLTGLAPGQSAWWEPQVPLIGEPFSVFYDPSTGTLPEDVAQVWIHWGVVDDDGNWSAPPQATWPEGSQLSGDGAACQSPLDEDDGIWSVTINPDETIEIVEFVFTDMVDNWDNNNGNNWTINFATGDVVSWWSPAEPEPGDEITVFYNVDIGTIPDNPDNLILHWGINEIGHGNWQEPPQEMWPEGTNTAGDGMAVRSPMNDEGNGIWSVSIQTNEDTYTLHYVVTDGTNWDSNGGENWNIELDEPPPLTNTWHTFYYDTRSSWANYDVADIANIYLAGPFNDWSTNSIELDGPDLSGVYWIDMNIPAIATPYKFVVNGVHWTTDPDNPLNDGGPTGNSLVILEQRETAYFQHVELSSDRVMGPNETFSLSAIIRPPDTDQVLDGSVSIVFRGENFTPVWDMETGIINHAGLSTGDVSGMAELELVYEDEGYPAVHFRTTIGWHGEDDGYLMVDDFLDDTGPGIYISPLEEEHTADFNAVRISEIADGDSLYFEITMLSVDPSTRVMLQISSDIDGMTVPPPLVGMELLTPEWNGTGVQLILADPETEEYDPELHNILITGRDPLENGSSIELHEDELADNRYAFNLAVDDLETVLGSFNSGWYFAAVSYYEGPNPTWSHSYEVDEAHGGVNQTYDPDNYDLLFTDTSDLQRRLIANNAPDRTAVLDNTGRGFVRIEPDEIGPNVGSGGPVLRLLTRGAPTVREEWTITGIVEAEDPIDVILRHEHGDEEDQHLIEAVEDTFSIDVALDPGVNTFRAEATFEDETGVSPAIVFELIVPTAPVAVFDHSVDGGTVYLDASASYDPQEQEMSFQWTPDVDNPADVVLQDDDEDIAGFTTPGEPGEYYFDLVIEDTEDNVTNARTVVTIYSDSVDVFDLDESVQWVREATVYEIFVRAYADSDHLLAIAGDMERITDLGVNTIWLTPVHPGPTTHGYEIVDYYGIDSDIGTPNDFGQLIQAAHDHDIRVILDLVINHTSIQHPFMRDAMQFGEYSPYYDWYQRDANGAHTYYYDWYSLPNLNYDNPDVWKYFIDMSAWWVEEYDIDGYRCDVAWGPQERNDQFWIEWRTMLKTIKPELLLLAEANGRDFDILTDRFDLGYDWSLFHDGFSNLFDAPGGWDNIHSLVINEYGGDVYDWPNYKYPFRFLENHDENRYISLHAPNQTKMAATLLFTIPGVPMIYAGQEYGETSQRERLNFQSDPFEVNQHYCRIIKARNILPSLSWGDFTRLENDQEDFVYSVMRYAEGEIPLIGVFNNISTSRIVTIQVPVEELGLNPGDTYVLSEIIANTSSQRTGESLASITTSMNSYGSRLYAIADSVVLFDVPEENNNVPHEFALEQNYPNPFNPDCVIGFVLPEQTNVSLAIYNILGQKVKTLIETRMTAGKHLVAWDGLDESGNTLASGVYFCRIEAGRFIQTRKMVMIK